MNIEHEMGVVDLMADKFRHEGDIKPAGLLIEALLDALTDPGNFLTPGSRTAIIFSVAQLVAREPKS